MRFEIPIIPCRRTRFRCLFSIILLSAATTDSLSQQTPEGDRLIHHFDFDERHDGNLESLPKFWTRIDGDGFPRYAEGRFDGSTGHDAPPAFRLDAEGRNIAYRYQGGQLPVHGASEYLVSAWVRGRDLAHARAVISAYYVDYDGLPMADTQRFSAFVDTQNESDEWRRIEVFLPAGSANARSIGITLWIVHPEIWRTEPRPRRYIERKDVSARAWFDDIRIHRLPYARLRTPKTANVMTGPLDSMLTVEVIDPQHAGLQASLDVFDIDGTQITSFDVPVKPRKEARPIDFPLQSLENGYYVARLTVRSMNDEVLAVQERAFARLRPHAYRDPGVARSFGVVVEVSDRSGPDVELALLRALDVGVVKMPIWSGMADVPDLIDSAHTVDLMLYELLKARVAVTGVFVGPPSDLVRAAGAYRRSLLTMLRDDPEAWREHLVSVFAPYASIFRSWQIGTDGDTSVIQDDRLNEAVSRVREEIGKLTTSSHLTIPGSLLWEPLPDSPPVDGVSFAIDPSIAPDRIADHLKVYADADQHVETVFVASLDVENVDRRGQLRDWCKRLLQARHAGVATVLVPQPWRTRASAAMTVTEPTEEFVVLHTLVSLLGDAKPREEVYVAPSVAALAFSDGERTLLAMWDREAGPDGRKHLLQLGESATLVDLWGRRRQLARSADGRQRLVLTQEPIFIVGAEHWLVDFRTRLDVSPRFVELSIAEHELEVRIRNPRNEPIAGTTEIAAPSGWDIEPREFRFSVRAGEEIVRPIHLRLRRDATAGTREMRFSFKLDADNGYLVVVPIKMELGVKEIIAWGHTVESDDRLIVRHRITNRSTEPMNLKAFAVAPGRMRQTRQLMRFLPGQTATLEYHFKQPESLQGRHIRLNLRDLDSARIHNIEVEIE